MMHQRLLNFFTNNRGNSVIPSDENQRFVDLTPSDDADRDGSYSKALEYAINENRIKNIALTGPYGSGKSSIIKTFEKNNRSKYRFLNISLASFKEEDKDSSDEFQSRLIEKSILQQMLYGADADNLPYSRFKRITTPVYPLIKSFILVFWAISVFGLIQYKNELLDPYFIPWWLWVVIFAFVLSMPVVLISDLYKALFGISLKKISLTNAEIETGQQTEESILNRHLDEIIYFFQSTKYNVVVIEDLDRFGNPEIFVKLREINKLVNDNKQANGNIKFLYALKDDMFVHKNRAKFFDFIIPVVPIINSYNSLDMMQMRLKNLSLEQHIDTQFLREASLYVDDLRLIHNIFNEFLIYYDRLKSESLDATKLLAMMIYKNIYPDDFEKLHHGEGILFELCYKKFEFLQNIKKNLYINIDELNTSLEFARKEKLRSVRELISVYIAHIIYQINLPVIGIFCRYKFIPLSQFTTFDKFEPIISETNICIATHSQQHQNHINKSFKDIENEVNPDESFLNRKQNIENKSDEEIKKIQKKIRNLENEIAELQHKRLSQLLELSEVNFAEILKKPITSEEQLLIYLVRNGYIDDSYHLYISNFHEGRLTKNDRDFLLTVRNFSYLDPNLIIDTPEEVCANLREEDFGHRYVLNVILMDYLIESESKHIRDATKYISKNYDQAEDFFSAYFISGKQLRAFIRELCNTWPGFSSAALGSKQAAEKISYILRFVDAEYLANRMNSEDIISNFLAEEGHLVFASDIQAPDDYDVLKRLNVRFLSLPLLEINEPLLEYLHRESLYAITPENVNYLLQEYAITSAIGELNIEKANYTSICTIGSEYLQEYIEDNLANYIDRVFLVLPENSMECEATIKTLINNEKITESQKKKIISKQEYVFETFIGVPSEFWTYLIEVEKVTASWGNISVYLDSESPDNKLVTEFIQRAENLDKLLKQKISTENPEDEKRKSLSQFILYNDDIKDHNYYELIQCLPYWYIDFPSNISEKKLETLALTKKVKLTKKSFATAANNNRLLAILIEKNFDVYLADKEAYPIADGIRELLLLSELDLDHKIVICLDVTNQGAINNKSLLSAMASVLVQSEADCSEIDRQILSAVIINAEKEDDSIRILIRCIPYWSETEVMDALSHLNEPYSEMATYGRRPKLNKNKLNVELSELLKNRGFISSIKVGKDDIRIITRRSADHIEGN